MRNYKLYLSIALSFLIVFTASAQDKKNGIIALQINDNDSMHVITAYVTDAATQLPLKDVEITFYVKRTFGLMKVADGTSDSTGIVSGEFPRTIPASDTSNKLIVLAKVEDNDVINDTVFQTTAQSKLKFPKDIPVPRSIIGAHAPWWLVITFISVVGTVWLLFVYVVYLVYRIKKASAVKINS